MEGKNGVLQIHLERALQQAGLGKYLQQRQLAVSLIDLSAGTNLDYAGLNDDVTVLTLAQLDQAILEHRPVVTEDPFLLARSEQIDVLCDVTGSVELALPS